MKTLIATAVTATAVAAAPTATDDNGATGGNADTLTGNDIVNVHRTHERRGRRGPHFRGGRKPAPGGINRHTGYGFANWAGDITIPGSADCGKPVRSWRRGTVIDVTRLRTSYGKHVAVRHLRGKVTLYAHMRSINVRVGEFLHRAERLGRVGSTGKSSGCHLHFEVRP